MGKQGLIDPETYVFGFGKHKGMTFKEVFEEEPQYLMWCHENIDWFQLSCETVDDIERILYDDNWEDDVWIGGKR